MKIKELSKNEWNVLKDNIRIRATGKDTIVYALDEFGQVSEIGSKAPIPDMVASCRGVYDKIKMKYQALLEMALKDAENGVEAYLNILNYPDPRTGGDPYPKTFTDWLSCAIAVAKKSHCDDFEMMIGAEGISYISNTKGTPTYFYFDKDLVPGECPLWMHYRVRFQSDQEWEFFKAWVWTVFDAKIKNRQILYILDTHGSSGKSTMVNALCSYLGKAATSISGATLHSRFGLENIVGKRFVSYPEVKNPRFMELADIKSITGGDTVAITRKGKPTIQEKLFAKILMTSNDVPEINCSDRSELSRLVVLKWRTNEELIKDHVAKEFLREYLEFDGNTPRMTNIGFDYKGKYGENPSQVLIDEMPAFLFQCKQAFDTIEKSNNEIKVPETVLENNVEEYASSESVLLKEFFSEWFDFNPNGATKLTKLQSALAFYHRKTRSLANLKQAQRLLIKAIAELRKQYPQIEKFWRGNAVFYRGISIRPLGMDSASAVDPILNPVVGEVNGYSQVG